MISDSIDFIVVAQAALKIFGLGSSQLFLLSYLVVFFMCEFLSDLAVADLFTTHGLGFDWDCCCGATGVVNLWLRI